MKGEYEIGRGKPPQHSRFKKGQSGNPKGRPKLKACESPVTSMQEILARPMTMNISGKKKKATIAEAVQMRIVMDALAGKPAAQRAILLIIQEIERGARATKTDQIMKVTFVKSLLDEITNASKAPLPNMMWDERKNDWRFRTQEEKQDRF